MTILEASNNLADIARMLQHTVRYSTVQGMQSSPVTAVEHYTQAITLMKQLESNMKATRQAVEIQCKATKSRIPRGLRRLSY